MAIYQLGALAPRIADTAWVADSAVVIGNVELGEEASVWFGAVLRGDNETLTIGRRSNVQDGSVLHADPGFPLVLGEGVTIGHQVMLHGCTHRRRLARRHPGRGAERRAIGRHCLVGAGARRHRRQGIPRRFADHGRAGAVVRPLTPEQIDGLKESAQHYVENARRYRDGLKRMA